MPDQNLTPMTPIELQIQQQAIQRQRDLAMMLQKDSLTPAQGQMIGNHFIAPSWTQYLAKTINGLVGAYDQRDLDQKQISLARQYGDMQMALARSLTGDQSGAAPQQAAPTAAPAAAAAPAPEAAPQVGGESTAGAATPDPRKLGEALQVSGADAYLGGGAKTSQNGGQAMTSSGAPFQPTTGSNQFKTNANALFRGVDPALLAQFLQSPDSAYGKVVQLQMQNNTKAMEPTDIVKNLRAAGVQEGSPQWTQAINAAVQKAGYIAPTPIRPGSFVQSPNGSMSQVPAVPEGFQAVPNGQGGWSIAPVQGGLEAISASAGAKAGGQAAFQPEKVWDPVSGQYVFTTKANIATAAGGAGGAPGQAPRFVGQDLLEQVPANVRAGILNDAKSGDGRFKLNYQLPDGRRISGMIDLNSAAGAAPGKGGAFAAEPAPGMTAGADVMAKGNANGYQALKTQAEGASDRINALDNILELANGATKYGPGTSARLERLSTINAVLPSGMALGNDDTKNAQVMQKYVSNLAGQYMKALGGTGTDAQLSNALKSIANPDMMNAAIKEVIPKLKAMEAAVQGKINGYDAWLAQGNNVANGNQYESLFRNAYEPKVFQVMQMPADQRAAYVRSMPESEYAKFTSKYQALKKLNALPQQ